jgi:hypothetical protein
MFNATQTLTKKRVFNFLNDLKTIPYVTYSHAGDKNDPQPPPAPDTKKPARLGVPASAWSGPKAQLRASSGT